MIKKRIWLASLLVAVLVAACAPKPEVPPPPPAEQQLGAIEQDVAELDQLNAELNASELNDIDAALGELEELPLG